MIRAMTQHEVAAELGISQGRVLQLEQSAFRKLRANPEFKELLKMVRFAPSPSKDKEPQDAR